MLVCPAHYSRFHFDRYGTSSKISTQNKAHEPKRNSYKEISAGINLLKEKKRIK